MNSGQPAASRDHSASILGFPGPGPRKGASPDIPRTFLTGCGGPRLRAFAAAGFTSWGMLLRIAIAGLLAAPLFAGCGSAPPGSLERGMGPVPELPDPHGSLIPVVEIAPVVGWEEGATPHGAPGTRVTLFAGGLEHPRWLHVLPNGDVLVAETNAPERPQAVPGRKGIRGFFMK